MNFSNLYSTPLSELNFAVVDTETTGMHSKFNKIIEIGIVNISNLKIVDKWESLINPQQDIPFWITNFTSITPDNVANKPIFAQLQPQITQRIQNNVIVGHNVGFDYSFLQNEFSRLNIKFEQPRLCTVLLGRKFIPNLEHYNLDYLIEHFNLKISKRHRALDDAYATAEIFVEFLNYAIKDYKCKNFVDLAKLQKNGGFRSKLLKTTNFNNSNNLKSLFD